MSPYINRRRAVWRDCSIDFILFSHMHSISERISILESFIYVFDSKGLNRINVPAV